MIYVLGETVYECELNDLPKNCYYFDTNDCVLVGKFDQINVLMFMGTFIQEETIYCPQFDIKTSNHKCTELNDLMEGLSLYDFIFTYEDIFTRHSSDIDVLKGKILNFYIEHKPIFTKSAKLN